MSTIAFRYFAFMLPVFSMSQWAWASFLISPSPIKGRNVFISSSHRCSTSASSVATTFLRCKTATSCSRRCLILGGWMWGSTWKKENWTLMPVPRKDFLQNTWLSVAAVSHTLKSHLLVSPYPSVHPQFPFPHQHQKKGVGKAGNKLQTQLYTLIYQRAGHLTGYHLSWWPSIGEHWIVIFGVLHLLLAGLTDADKKHALLWRLRVIYTNSPSVTRWLPF